MRARGLSLLCASLVALAGCSAPLAPRLRPDPEPLQVPSATFSFLVIGDFGTGAAIERAVAVGARAWAEASGTEAVITTGDNVYPDGSPTYYDEAWDEPYGWVTEEGIDVVASLGNHDVQHGEGRGVMELLDMPSRYYSHVEGDAEVFVLDTTDPADPEQLAWLERALASSIAAWRIAVFHHPAHTCGRYSPEPTVRADWLPLFQRYDVDLVFTGHDHNYQRFSEQEGVTYVVTGGGGAGLYEVHECPGLTAHDDEKHHFVVIEGSTEELRGKVVALDGSVLDEFSLRP
ncbi:MAG: metallophosphoesterase family protein [Actinomycetota bacterium]